MTQSEPLTSRAIISPHQLYVILCAIFVTSLVVADLTGSRLFTLGSWTLNLPWGVRIHELSTGIIPFPITFVLTDLLNEFYGKKGAKFVTWVGFGMALFTYSIIYMAMGLPTSDNSVIPHESFVLVFSNNVIVASLTAYLVGQFLDIYVFGLLRQITKERFLWLRATGSTVVSQLVDSFIVTSIAFYGKLPWQDIASVGLGNYSVKFIIAVALTPVLYLGHSLIESLLNLTPESEVALEADSEGMDIVGR